MDNRTALTIGLLGVTGILVPEMALAQVTDTGDSLILNQGVYTIETGERFNTSNIPLPTVIPDFVSEREPLPVNRSFLSATDVEVRANDSYLVDTIRDQTGYEITDYTLNVEVEANRVRGAHKFAEGIEVIGGNGSTETAFVSGSGVHRDNEGNQLGESVVLTTEFDRGESATIGFRNIRTNEGEIKQSGVTFDSNGNLRTEDLQDGGDLDFNDGDYSINVDGFATADIQRVDSTQETTSYTQDWDLEPRTTSNQLGFLDENGEFTSSTRIYAETSGDLGITHQFSPLNNSSRPTLLNVGLRTNFESVSASVGVNQFITPVYQTVESESLSDYLVLYPTEEGSGQGSAAYQNTGGVVVEYVDGTFEFLTQWTVDSKYNQETYFNAADVVSFHSALIPEQHNTNLLAAGDRFELTLDNGIFYSGNTVVIVESVQPQNFSAISDTLYGVEDTNPSNNYAVEQFDGNRIEGTLDYNDAFVSLQYDRPIETIQTIVPNRFGIVAGAELSLGLGNRRTTTVTTQTDNVSTGKADLSIDSQGLVSVVGLNTHEASNTFVVSEDVHNSVGVSPIEYQATLAAVWNYGGDVWTEQADQIRVEAYTGSNSGVRAEVRDNFIGVPLYTRVNHEFNGETTVTGGVSVSF